MLYYFDLNHLKSIGYKSYILSSKKEKEDDIFLLETLILIAVSFYISSTNLLMLLYTGGLYLFLVGMLALVNDSDLFVGFL